MLKTRQTETGPNGMGWDGSGDDISRWSDGLLGAAGQFISDVPAGRATMELCYKRLIKQSGTTGPDVYYGRRAQQRLFRLFLLLYATARARENCRAVLRDTFFSMRRQKLAKSYSEDEEEIQNSRSLHSDEADIKWTLPHPSPSHTLTPIFKNVSLLLNNARFAIRVQTFSEFLLHLQKSTCVS